MAIIKPCTGDYPTLICRCGEKVELFDHYDDDTGDQGWLGICICKMRYFIVRAY